MSKKEKRARKFGDRRDARRVKDAPGLNIIMANLYPNRTDCEVCLRQEFDVTELLKHIASKNGPDAEYKTTFFHCFVLIVARLLRERPYLNRFIQGRRVYERDSVSVSFIAKRRFTEHSEEALMQYIAKDDDTLDDVSRFIVGDVKKMRTSDVKGLDDTINKIAKLPRLLLMFVVRTIRWLDFWGKVPKFLTEGDSNYSSVLLSNLGSIRCPAVYHHLNNYGTTSVFVAIGTIHKKQVTLPDGSVELRDFVEIAATIDERIADGFYFMRSLKLVQHICSHPELLDKPLKENSGYDYV